MPDFACKSKIATVYYWDRKGTLPHRVEIQCDLEGKQCKEEGHQCKQVFWNNRREFEIHHFCACVPKEKEGGVDFGPPSGQMVPCPEKESGWPHHGAPVCGPLPQRR